jgi:hypothetical protein
VSRVPEEFHFIFGLRPQTEPFHIVWYLCLASCIAVNSPRRVHLHYHHEPHGSWWDRIKPRLVLHRTAPETFVLNNPRYLESAEGRFIKQVGLDYAHQSDFLRLKILLDHGGVYADMDTLFVNPLPRHLFDQQCVLGEEDPVQRPDGSVEVSLCNAVIMAAPGAAFIRRWLARMYSVFDGTWSRHSCVEAGKLRSEFPDELLVAPKRYFYKHMWTREGIHTLLQGCDTDYTDVYSMHLWAHLWWEPWRTDFTEFHKGMLTEDYICSVDTTFNVVARRFLDESRAVCRRPRP